ncbi:hypothetical protein Glove_161g46 [Diversispora epigaea]|uniref:Uncharacterized protein n=1 Tax=Diversispora epigaea TaxID=1348612 RepID=A0A397IRC4_9GLOM|nr:hypothetical protein Glove_161g46 [Diversispora epigaea]
MLFPLQLKDYGYTCVLDMAKLQTETQDNELETEIQEVNSESEIQDINHEINIQDIDSKTESLIEENEVLNNSEDNENNNIDIEDISQKFTDHLSEYNELETEIQEVNSESEIQDINHEINIQDIDSKTESLIEENEVLNNSEDNENNNIDIEDISQKFTDHLSECEKICNSSIQVMYLTTESPSVRSKAIMPLSLIDLNNEYPYWDDQIEKYFHRPVDEIFNNITYRKYYEKYNISKSKTTQQKKIYTMMV